MKNNYWKTSYGRKYRAAHPQEVIAQRLLASEVRAGRIKRLPCEVCGNPKSQGHHPDYNKPLEVKWLCQKHHKEEHRRMEAVKPVDLKRICESCKSAISDSNHRRRCRHCKKLICSNCYHFTRNYLNVGRKTHQCVPTPKRSRSGVCKGCSLLRSIRRDGLCWTCLGGSRLLRRKS